MYVATMLVPALLVEIWNVRVHPRPPVPPQVTLHDGVVFNDIHVPRGEPCGNPVKPAVFVARIQYWAPIVALDGEYQLAKNPEPCPLVVPFAENTIDAIAVPLNRSSEIVQIALPLGRNVPAIETPLNIPTRIGPEVEMAVPSVADVAVPVGT